MVNFHCREKEANIYLGCYVKKDSRFNHFFFSSIRRHTRWPRDWSSDGALPISGGRRFETGWLHSSCIAADPQPDWGRQRPRAPLRGDVLAVLDPSEDGGKSGGRARSSSGRSEERRVGKEST